MYQTIVVPIDPGGFAEPALLPAVDHLVVEELRVPFRRAHL